MSFFQYKPKNISETFDIHTFVHNSFGTEITLLQKVNLDPFYVETKGF